MASMTAGGSDQSAAAGSPTILTLVLPTSSCRQVLADKFLPTQGHETWREPAFFVRVEPHSAWTGRLHRSAELMLLVYERLRLLAKKLLRNESSGHTLQPTALVNEAYLRMVGQREMD